MELSLRERAAQLGNPASESMHQNLKLADKNSDYFFFLLRATPPCPLAYNLM